MLSRRHQRTTCHQDKCWLVGRRYHHAVAGREPHGPGTVEPAKRTRVLLAIKGLAHGGAESLLVDTLVAGSSGFDYEVAFVMASADALAPAIVAHGIPVHDLGAKSNLDLRWVLRFRRLVADGQFDIVHFHLPYTAALGRPAALSVARRSRPVTIYTEHSLWNKVSPPVKALNRVTVGTDGALIAVSQAAYEALPTRLRRRTRV